MATILTEPQKSSHDGSVRGGDRDSQQHRKRRHRKKHGHERAVETPVQSETNQAHYRRRRKHRDRRTHDHSEHEATTSGTPMSQSDMGRRHRDRTEDEHTRDHTPHTDSEEVRSAEYAGETSTDNVGTVTSPMASAVISAVRDHRPPPQPPQLAHAKQLGKRRKPPVNPTVLALDGKGNATYFRDFDLKTKLRNPVNPPLGRLPPEKYQEKPSLQLQMMRRDSTGKNVRRGGIARERRLYCAWVIPSRLTQGCLGAAWTRACFETVICHRNPHVQSTEQ